MGMMNQVVKLPQLNKVMMTMSREMEKAGLIEVFFKVVCEYFSKLRF